jgi:hypothetical protein
MIVADIQSLKLRLFYLPWFIPVIDYTPLALERPCPTAQNPMADPSTEALPREN